MEIELEQVLVASLADPLAAADGIGDPRMHPWCSDVALPHVTLEESGVGDVAGFEESDECREPRESLRIGIGPDRKSTRLNSSHLGISCRLSSPTRRSSDLLEQVLVASLADPLAAADGIGDPRMHPWCSDVALPHVTLEESGVGDVAGFEESDECREPRESLRIGIG